MQVALKTFAVDDTSVSGYIYHRYFQTLVYGRVGGSFRGDMTKLEPKPAMCAVLGCHQQQGRRGSCGDCCPPSQSYLCRTRMGQPRQQPGRVFSPVKQKSPQCNVARVCPGMSHRSFSSRNTEAPLGFSPVCWLRTCCCTSVYQSQTTQPSVDHVDVCFTSLFSPLPNICSLHKPGHV